MEQKKRGKNGWRIGGVSALVLVAAAAVWAVTSSGRAERILQKYAYFWNVRCPMPMDDHTTLNRVVVLPGHVLVYQISGTLPKSVYEATGGMDEFRENARKNMVEDLRAQSGFSMIKRLGITFRYAYKDTNGVPLTEIEIAPEDYR